LLYLRIGRRIGRRYLGVLSARKFVHSPNVGISLVWRRIVGLKRIKCDDACSIEKSLRTILMWLAPCPTFRMDLYCVSEQRPSIVVDPVRMILLVIVLFGEAPEMIALPSRDSVPVSCSRWQYSIWVCRYTLRAF